MDPAGGQAVFAEGQPQVGDLFGRNVDAGSGVLELVGNTGIVEAFEDLGRIVLAQLPVEKPHRRVRSPAEDGNRSCCDSQEAAQHDDALDEAGVVPQILKVLEYRVHGWVLGQWALGGQTCMLMVVL